MNYILIENGVVIQSDRTGDPPKEFVEAPDYIVPGYLYDGKDFALPEPVITIPNRVSARQFKMQLEKQGLLASVEAWVGQQEKLVQIAYANSSSFVRSEPMMQAGFQALGFSSGQIDAFFTAAAAL